MSNKKAKLVRDNIPEIVKQKGGTPVSHLATEDEYLKMLLEKLQEEVDEFKAEQNIEELADILEVIDALIVAHNFNKTEIEQVKNKKLAERGGFTKKIILEDW